MGAITATAQLPPVSDQPRVDVALSGWSPTSGPVTVYRVHADGTRRVVRGMPDVSGGVSQVYDYEAPLSESFFYESADSGGLVVSASVTLADDRTWVHAPGLPAYTLPVLLESVPDAEWSRPAADLDGPFRSVAPSLTGEPSGEVIAPVLMTRSAADAATLTALLRQAAVVLLRVPRTEYAHRYLEVTRVARATRVGYRRQDPADTTSVADWRDFRLAARETLPPPGGAFGDPSASYQLLLDSGRTYQGLLDWRGVGATTYLDVLRGGF